MIDKDKIASEFAEAAHLMDKSVDTDIAIIDRKKREELLNEWNEEQARQTASEQGIELTEEHFLVVHKLREYFHEHGASQSGRQLSEILEKTFAKQGGKKYLRRLFPDGPVRQGMMIAGLTVPAHTEDEGFGTSR